MNHEQYIFFLLPPNEQPHLAKLALCFTVGGGNGYGDPEFVSITVFRDGISTTIDRSPEWVWEAIRECAHDTHNLSSMTQAQVSFPLTFSRENARTIWRGLVQKGWHLW